MNGTGAPAAGDTLPEIIVEMDPVRLFAYSALTWNPHRIHYDAPYTIEVEGYPGLVVQGPLLGGLLIRCVQEWAQSWGGQIVDVDYRSTVPVYAGQTVRASGEVVAATSREASVELRAVVDEQVVCAGRGTVWRGRSHL